MEEGERRELFVLGQDQNRLSGFADQLASSLLKETISEAGNSKEKEQVWSIPCSSECYSHRHERVSTSSSGRVRGSGQLCWTPESSGSLDNTMEGRNGNHNTCRENRPNESLELVNNDSENGIAIQTEDSENCCQNNESCLEGENVLTSVTGRNSDICEPSRNSQSLRKGLSVPDVGLDDIQDRVSFGSENSKSHKIGFLRHLGLKRSKAEGSTDPGRRKIKSIRKTLSSLFHLRNKFEPDEENDARESRSKRPTSAPSIFRFPTRKPKNVPPCQRPLPSVPGLNASSTSVPSSSIADGARSLSTLTLENEASATTSESVPRNDTEADNIDFAASIEKVKDHGWYWGPLSGEAAERILSGEPDGSFVVRDSSDHHYIFSLTFKLNGFVRHVRIEHDQGNFSFGSFTKFKSNTIVDFIENAVEHSRSGRYLFFLHRRPVLGPMRVQLLHPVSRFKRVQSLQHLCRYIIVKHVRKDHLDQLPVPSRIKTYLNTSFYYSEQVAEDEEAAADAGVNQMRLDVENLLENADVFNRDTVEEDTLRTDESINDGDLDLGANNESDIRTS